jgi:hypothetical protein
MNRRELLKLSSCALAAASASAVAAASSEAAAPASSQRTARWDHVEFTFRGPDAGNPFLDVQLSASFRLKNRVRTVQGFYDGDSAYKIRFMPDELGTWTWETASNVPALSGKTGAFECVAAQAGNHGPVSVRDTFHFGYADGTPYVECGTTCYAWAFQAETTQRQTIETLKAAPFNKLRMCVFPKWYQHNHNEPPLYPFPRNSETNDYSRFNPAYFQHLEKLILTLQSVGVEADLILFHPYDKWGYQQMPAEVDDRYLRYVIARFGAFRNVWWSLANEFDLLKHKTSADWDRFAHIVTSEDPYGHLRSVHNCHVLYDWARGWCTHAGVQDSRVEMAAQWRADWGKPVVFDECKYEGNIASQWGNISADAMTRRFWMAAVQGAYCGHGETFLNDKDILWWSHGGVLHGKSPARITLLRKLLEETIAVGEGPIGFTYLGDHPVYCAKRPNNTVLFFYTDEHQPAEMTFQLPEGHAYTAEFIDTLTLERIQLPGEYSGNASFTLPGRPWSSIWLREKGIA